MHSNGPDAQGLARRVQRLEDIEAVRRLQYVYGYFMDHGFAEDAAEQFAVDGEIEIGRRGLYRGRSRVLEFLREVHRGGQGPVKAGETLNHLIVQGVIDIDDSGTQATARFRTFNQVATVDETGELVELAPDVYAFLSEGSYQNTYVKRDGTWKIRRLRWLANWYVPWNEFRRAWWFSAPPSTSCPPDEGSTFIDVPNAQRPLLPFHFSGNRAPADHGVQDR